MQEIGKIQVLRNMNIEEKELLQLIIDNISYLVLWKDKNSIFLGCNLLFAKAVGLNNSEEIIGKTDFDLGISEEQAKEYREIDQIVINTNKPQIYTIPSYNSDKGWLEVTKLPLKDKNGEILGIIGVLRDITDQIKAQQKLIQNGEKYKHLIESTKTAYIILNESFQILETNDVLHELLGYENQKLIGTNLRTIVHRKDILAFDGACSQLLKGNLIQDAEMALIDSHKELVTVSMTANLVENGAKKIICIFRDISYKKKMEEQKYIQTERKKDKLRQNIVSIRSTFQKIIEDYN